MVVKGPGDLTEQVFGPNSRIPINNNSNKITLLLLLFNAFNVFTTCTCLDRYGCKLQLVSGGIQPQDDKSRLSVVLCYFGVALLPSCEIFVSPSCMIAKVTSAL